MAQIIRVAADDNDLGLTAFTRVLGAWLVGGSADSSALVYNALTVTGTDVFSLKALLNTTSPYLKLGEIGIAFKVGISVDITGAGAVLYLVVE